VSVSAVAGSCAFGPAGAGGLSPGGTPGAAGSVGALLALP
jgi:hypothetical protein